MNNNIDPDITYNNVDNIDSNPDNNNDPSIIVINIASNMCVNNNDRNIVTNIDSAISTNSALHCTAVQ